LRFLEQTVFGSSIDASGWYFFGRRSGALVIFLPHGFEGRLPDGPVELDTAAADRALPRWSLKIFSLALRPCPLLYKKYAPVFQLNHSFIDGNRTRAIFLTFAPIGGQVANDDSLYYYYYFIADSKITLEYLVPNANGVFSDATRPEVPDRNPQLSNTSTHHNGPRGAGVEPSSNPWKRRMTSRPRFPRLRDEFEFALSVRSRANLAFPSNASLVLLACARAAELPVFCHNSLANRASAFGVHRLGLALQAETAALLGISAV
jgi:hypothetical protein